MGAKKRNKSCIIKHNKAQDCRILQFCALLCFNAPPPNFMYKKDTRLSAVVSILLNPFQHLHLIKI